MASEKSQQTQNQPAEEGGPSGEISTTVPEIAMLNNMLPRGYRFELYENVRKSSPFEARSGKRKKPVRVRCSNPL